jgi:sialic acid synthase SpsE
MSNTVTIANRVIGQGHPVFIIGEVGSCHDGKLSQAKELIDAVAEAGADAVKFQFFTGKDLYSQSDARCDASKPYETPRDWIPELAGYAKSRGILCSASPFDIEAVDFLVQAGAPFLKIASPEIRDYPLLEYCAGTGLPLIISTGVSTLADVELAMNCVRKAGATDIVLLQCPSIYPTQPADVNLRVIATLRHAFGVPTGLSDHSMSTYIPCASVALGACVIEKHITLDRSLKGPDHPISLNVAEFRQMVKGVREVELALGSPVKRIIEGKERPDLHEKSIVAKVDILEGDKITPDMVIIKRGYGGIESVLLDKVIGRTARKTVSADTILTWDVI